ncbi:MAG: response regulator transcription factor [Synechococcales bacterium]|nr:response regulator transcription factor [Synechococcales bacterium]
MTKKNVKTILVIEDEKTVRESLLDLLEVEGYAAIGAENGQQGLQLASQADLVLCDVQMPEMDGFMLLQNLRRQSKTATLPFIFITARTTKADLRRGMELGADDYLFKPFTISELLRAISTRLSKQAAIAQTNPSSASNATSLNSTNSDSRDGLLNFFYQELRNPLSNLNLVIYLLHQSQSNPTAMLQTLQTDYARELSALSQLSQMGKELLAPECARLLANPNLQAWLNSQIDHSPLGRNPNFSNPSIMPQA